MFGLESGVATNVELKLSDSVANIHLELASILSAGLDGISRKLALRPCSDDDQNSQPLPTSLPASLDILKENTLFGSVLGRGLLTNYVLLRSAEANVALKVSLADEVVNAYNQA